MHSPILTAVDGRDPSPNPLGHRLCVALLAVLVLTAAPLAMANTATAQPSTELPAEPALLIVLEPDGSARVTLTVVFDLGTDADRTAFDALRANTTAREQHVEQFASRMQAIADRATATGDRDMRITEPNIAFVERNGTGIVAISVTWTDLAARSGEALVLREPFGSEFSIDRALYVVGPDGYVLESASPTPTKQRSAQAMWVAGMSLDGIEVTFAPADSTTGGAIGETPGFTFGGSLLALLLIAAMAIGRSRRW